VVAAHELGLGLRQVEGQAVGLGEGGDQEDHEGQRLLEDHPAVLGLVADDLAQVEALGEQEDRDHAHAHGDLVGDHLGAGADAAEEGVLGVGTVAGEHDAVHAEGDDAEGVEDADVQVGDDHLLAPEVRPEGNDRDGQQRRDHRDGRRQPEVHLAHVARGEVLLEQELQAVGRGLEDAQLHQERTDDRQVVDEERGRTIGADPVLDPRRHLALDEDGVGHGRHHHTEDHADLQGAEEDHLRRRTEIVDRFHGRFRIAP